MEGKTRNKWNTDDIITFLNTFRNFEVLWDIKHSDYYNKNRRELAMSKLRSELLSHKIKVPDAMFLRAKIKNIKSTYRQELQKIVHSEKRWKDDEVYEPRLCWFKTADSFLREVASARPFSSKSRRNDDQRTEMDSDEMMDTEVDIKQEEIYNNTNTQDVYENLPEKRPNKNEMQGQLEVENVRTTIEWPGIGVSSGSQSITTPAPAIDEYDAFGVHVANQLRQLPTRSFVILQEKIQSLITKERLNNMRDT